MRRAREVLSLGAFLDREDFAALRAGEMERTSACSRICAPAFCAARARPESTRPGSTVPPGTVRTTRRSPESFQWIGEFLRAGERASS